MGLEKTRLALLYISSAHLVHPDPCKQNLGLRICGYVGCSQKKNYANTNTTQKHAQHAHTHAACSTKYSPTYFFFGAAAFHALHISCAIFCLAATFQVVKRLLRPAAAASLWHCVNSRMPRMTGTLAPRSAAV